MIAAIPNLSEGRRPEVVRALVDAVEAGPGVRLLDWSADPDHHRSVLTVVGEPAPLREMTLRLFAAAVPRIDLRVHEGGHPRIGAVDVVPFVPLGGARMETCAALARATGAAVAARFGIPVLLYAAAASTPARRPLEAIRRGGVEGLAARLATPAWAPDYGPAAPHPSAGATAIGARGPLLALNVVLASRDLALAREVARAVRARDGGLPHVKAIGVRLTRAGRDQVQVAMNLTCYRQTPVSTVLARVAREAARRGAAVAGVELVGLAPRAALDGAGGGASVLDRLPADRTLEARLARSGAGSSAPTSGRAADPATRP